MEAGRLWHWQTAWKGKVWQRLPGKRKEKQIHCCPQSPLQIPAAKSTGLPIGSGIFFPHWLLGGAPTSPRDRDPIPSTSPKHSPSLWLLLWRKQVGRSLIIWCPLGSLHFLIQGVSHLGVCSQGRALQEPAKPRARQVTLKIELNANYKFLCLGLPSPRQLSISARWQTHSPIVTARKSFTGIEMFSFRAKWNKA